MAFVERVEQRVQVPPGAVEVAFRKLSPPSEICPAASPTSTPPTWSTSRTLPLGWTLRGHQGVVEFFCRLTATVDSRVTTAALYGAGDTVAQFGRTAGRVTANGAVFDVPQCHIWRIVDGKAVSAEMLIDSGAMLEALED